MLAFVLFISETKPKKVNSSTHPKLDRYAKENCWYKKVVILKKNLYPLWPAMDAISRVQVRQVILEVVKDMKMWWSVCWESNRFLFPSKLEWCWWDFLPRYLLTPGRAHPVSDVHALLPTWKRSTRAQGTRGARGWQDPQGNPGHAETSQDPGPALRGAGSLCAAGHALAGDVTSTATPAVGPSSLIKVTAS